MLKKKNFADTCNFFQMYIITSTHRLPTPATFDTCQTLHTSTSSFTVCTLCTGWYVSFSPMVSLPYRLRLSTNSFWINVYGKKSPPPREGHEWVPLSKYEHDFLFAVTQLFTKLIYLCKPIFCLNISPSAVVWTLSWTYNYFHCICRSYHNPLTRLQLE